MSIEKWYNGTLSRLTKNNGHLSSTSPSSIDGTMFRKCALNLHEARSNMSTVDTFMFRFKWLRVRMCAVCACGSIFRHVHSDRVTEIRFCWVFIAFFVVQIDVIDNVLSVGFVWRFFLHIYLEHEVCDFVHFIPMAINHLWNWTTELLEEDKKKQKQWQQSQESLLESDTRNSKAMKKTLLWIVHLKFIRISI